MALPLVKCALYSYKFIRFFLAFVWILCLYDMTQDWKRDVGFAATGLAWFLSLIGWRLLRERKTFCGFYRRKCLATIAVCGLVFVLWSIAFGLFLATYLQDGPRIKFGAGSVGGSIMTLPLLCVTLSAGEVFVITPDTLRMCEGVPNHYIPVIRGRTRNIFDGDPKRLEDDEMTHGILLETGQVGLLEARFNHDESLRLSNFREERLRFE
ncbi:hypothetical protein GLAREA_05037 [Glarea lozoyensis ATCC 20868]|nr:uncharacterized protein GLAREA_05037 [Glarea lozoyensis ATCC 20868]EPE35700.1 hypothetical protein GLAREA_05037 [Glarea lozoyensis ATCC 20868]